MTITDPSWPPDEYSADIWPLPWLRYEVEYPGSGRPSRLVAHANVPYSAEITGDEDLELALKTVAGRYLGKVYDLIGKDWPPANGACAPQDPQVVPKSWLDALVPNGDPSNPGVIEWLDIWPAIAADDETKTDAPTLASWNLSRQKNGALPATVVMTAAEIYFEDDGVLSYTFGLRVPMAVEKTGDRVRVIIRSMTVELPTEGYLSATEIHAQGTERQRKLINDLLPVEKETSILSQLTLLSADSGFLDPNTMNAEQILFPKAAPDVVPDGIRLRLTSKGASSEAKDQGYAVRPGFPKRQSFQVVSTFEFPDVLLSTEVYPLVTHAADPGAAEIFAQTPPGWTDANDATSEYRFTLRRPTRRDEVLEHYRSSRDIGPAEGTTLEGAGFEVRRCPQYVPEDVGEGVKSVILPGGEDPLPRRNDYSAIMAYCYSADFFRFLADIGLPPETFVVRAQKKIEVYYRYGIFPGPGRSGRTINAQVAFDCTEAKQGIKPKIDMHLALATLNRWSRPKNPDNPAMHPDRRFLRPEPLGIASSGRWVLHEFGHYLIAARLGRLEFDFAHSAGDALAAVWYDPYSRLNHTRGDVDERFRGMTYPFVFTTRRHDRSPLLGWAWYGTLNRSVIAKPPVDCETLKGYLTEQILSSTVFQLYRALGGDTMQGNGPDDYIRYRASFMTLFLLIRAIAGFAQPPSKAEMLELGMEEAGLLMVDPLAVPPPNGVFASSPAPPQDDVWAGGVTHKVVRWAFEAQGMFVEDVEQTTNGPGRPAPVDIYLRDGRPTQETLPGGTTIYGPGSYAPVSLDWTGARRWMASQEPGFVLGNRGRVPAKSVRLRVWVGRLLGDMAQNRWDMDDKIEWIFSQSLAQPPDLVEGQESRVDLPSEVTEMMEAAIANGAEPVVILLESSCNDDLANSDPQASLAAAIANDANPPVKPRALTDLVAGDNNLALMLVGLG